MESLDSQGFERSDFNYFVMSADARKWKLVIIGSTNPTCGMSAVNLRFLFSLEQRLGENCGGFSHCYLKW